MTMMLLQAITSGLVTGCIYGLIALSIVIIYKSSDVVNFAGGEFVMTGGYVALFCLVFAGTGYALAFAFAALVTFIAGAVFQRVTMTRIEGRGYSRQTNLVPTIVATIGLSYLLKGVVRAVPYTEEPRRIAPLFKGPPLFFGDVVVQRQDVAIVLATVVIMVALWAFFRFSMTGRAMRATSQNARAACLVGMPVGLMRMGAWGLSAAIAGAAGVLLAPKLLLTPDAGDIVMLAFAAAIIGGFNSLPGCLVGGILLGILQNLVGVLIAPQAISVTPFFVIMAVLVLRPQGLFGGAVTLKKV